MRFQGAVQSWTTFVTIFCTRASFPTWANFVTTSWLRRSSRWTAYVTAVWPKASSSWATFVTILWPRSSQTFDRAFWVNPLDNETIYIDTVQGGYDVDGEFVPRNKTKKFNSTNPTHSVSILKFLN